MKAFDKIPVVTLQSDGFPVQKRGAIRAKCALIANVEGDLSDEHPKAMIVDALADLRHLCDALRFDFGALDKIAYGHYSVEKFQERKG